MVVSVDFLQHLTIRISQHGNQNLLTLLVSITHNSLVLQYSTSRHAPQGNPISFLNWSPKRWQQTVFGIQIWPSWVIDSLLWSPFCISAHSEYSADSPDHQTPDNPRNRWSLLSCPLSGFSDDVWICPLVLISANLDDGHDFRPRPPSAPPSYHPHHPQIHQDRRGIAALKPQWRMKRTVQVLVAFVNSIISLLDVHHQTRMNLTYLYC